MIKSPEAEELSRRKPKWGENIKVYNRRIHTDIQETNQSNGKNNGETGGKTAVESNVGDRSDAVNGRLNESNVGKNCESVVEEVPSNENGVKEVVNVIGNDVEKDCQNVVEEVSGNEDGVKEVVNVIRNDVEKNCEDVGEEVLGIENGVKEVITVTGNDIENNSKNVFKEVPANESGVKEVITVTGIDIEKNGENVVEEVPCNENINEEMAAATDNGCIIEETPTTTNDDEECSEKIIEEVPRNANSVTEMLGSVDSYKETSCNENSVMEVLDKGNTIEKVTDIEINIEVRNSMISIEDALINENDVEKAADIEKNVGEEMPDDETEIREEVPRVSLSPKLPVEQAKSLLPHHSPSNVKILTVFEDSSSRGLVEASLPNGHEYNGNLNGVVRHERPMASLVDDTLNTSVNSAKSKEEVRDLKRKLEDELDRVRKMARKLQAKETQLSAVDFDSGRLRDEAPVVERLRFPVNGRLENDVSTMTGNDKSSYDDYSSPRPFIQLSSSVTNSSYYGAVENVHEKEKRMPRANQFYQSSDFVLGKEKLPYAESNRKTKSSGGGRKHGGGDLYSKYGFDKNFHKKCNDLLQKLMKHKHGWVFNVPVDVKMFGLHDYFDVIKHPMDLGTVKTRLTNKWYKTPREFAEDVRLTFHNSMTYNPEGNDVHIMAKELLRIFEGKWPTIEADYDRKLRYEMSRDFGTVTPTSRKSYAPAHPSTHMPLHPPPLLHLPPSYQEVRNLERSQSMPVQPKSRPKSKPKSKPSVARTPAPKKPKAHDPNKRDMTFDEKQKLSNNLQCLPSDKLDAIAHIVKKRNSAFSQQDDEIEVDIDSLDAETLWELDRFVINYKKRLSKYKRKAELAMQAREELAMQSRAAASEAVQETVPPAPAHVDPPREDKTDERNAGASPHVQQERHKDNASDSSTTSSSSSDSGSSSSDSDSDSSSDSESDEES
ncbi:hypothetical protein vseg_007566 [Gypsophila vaccaria]